MKTFETELKTGGETEGKTEGKTDGETEGKTCGQTQQRSRYVPEELRRQVLDRDGYQCTYVAPDGKRCECKDYLQIDHIRPFAAGGLQELNNLRTLCGAHNRYVAERFFGTSRISRYRKGSA